MKKLRKLLVLLLLVMSGSVANGKPYFPSYQYPCIYDGDKGHITIYGLDINPNEKTLVIPNKIDGEWVEEIEDRTYEFRNTSYLGSGTAKFSAFRYSCPKDEEGNYIFTPLVNPGHCYDKGEVPTDFDTSVLGQQLQFEEIVLPYKVGAIWNHVYFRKIPTLKKIYLRAGYIGDFKIDLTGSPFVEEIHLMCWNTPRYSIDGTKIPVNPLYPGRKIKLYVPANKYVDYIERDTRWTNNPYFELLREPDNPTDGATLKIKNTFPNVTVSLGIFNIKGREGTEYVETFKYPRYYMPLCEVSHQGKGEVRVKLNGQYIDDCVGYVSPLELVPGENIMEVEFVTSSEVTIASNGNGSSVKWNGGPVLGASGGTYKASNVKSDANNYLEVVYNANIKNVVVRSGSTILNSTGATGNNHYYQIGKVMTDTNIDIQVTDKPCSITVYKTDVEGSLSATRVLNGQSYSTHLADAITFSAGQGTTLEILVPNTTHLLTAQLGGVDAVMVGGMNGVKIYKLTVPTSTSATLRLVGKTTLTTTQSNYTLQSFTKIGNGTVKYNTWYQDDHNEIIEKSGELTTPVSSIITPIGECEGCNGWSLNITPDPGYELTTLFGAWDAGDEVNGVEVPNLVDMLAEHAIWDETPGNEGHYSNLDGPTAEQKRAAGGDFKLQLESGRWLSYNASTHTYTFEVGTMEWDHASMAITIGFSNPSESSQRQVSVVAVGQPTGDILTLECQKPDNSIESETLTSTGSFTKRYLPDEFKYMYFVMNYEEGYDIEADGGQVRIPFTVYHNGEDVTDGFTYEDGQIICDLDENTMEGTWTFVFPDVAQTAETKWTFLKSGEGVLKCYIEPKDASADPMVYSVGDEGRTLRIETAAADLVMVKVEPTPGNTFKAYRNGDDVTGDFTLTDGMYILTTHQADLRDANWTVLFNEDVSSPYFTYQLSQTAGGEVTVGVIPVGGLTDDAPAELNVVQDGSMTLHLTNAEAEGIVIFVDPDQNMTVRIYEGDTDVTSQFTYDSATNTYMRQTSSLASESLLFVFADKDELGIDIIDFADAEVKRICVAPGLGWDTNGDGELSKAEAAAVTTLLRGEDSVFWSSDISSFDEFQYFTGLTSLEEYAFQDCSQLKHITLPESITSISEFAFDGCISLESIELPKTVESIGYLAFYNCSKLRSFFLPANVGSVEGALFFGCANLVSVVVDENNAVYDSRNNCNAIIQKDNKVLVSSCSTTSLPDDLEQIGPMAFAGLSVSRVEIPASIKSIGKEAFYQMSNLKTIVMKHSDPFAFNKMFFGSSSGYPSSLTLEVPEGTIDAYKQKGWKTLDEGGVFKEIREIPEYDANGDGRTTIVDVTRLVDKIIGK